MSMLLSTLDLADLTGYKRGKDQCGWLSERGWVFEIDAHGRPRVDRDYYKRKMGAKEAKTTGWQPDFSDMPQPG